jgi:AMP nucleosidase
MHITPSNFSSDDFNQINVEQKLSIVRDWLPRYTGKPLEKFGKFILLTNFINYVEMFAERFGVEVVGRDKPMQTATADNITIINFGMGSAMAATVMDLLMAIKPEALLFLGKCGGLKKKTNLGDFILPIAAIRGEGTSNDYMPQEVPALPSFRIHKTTSIIIREKELDYLTGTVYTTNRRVWEHDEAFKNYLRGIRAMAIDMETATIFSVGFINEIPRGALLMVSDNPMIPEGIKTSKSDKIVTSKFAEQHLSVGIDTLKRIESTGQSMKHMRFE